MNVTFLFLGLLMLLGPLTPLHAADWKVRRTDHWQKVATRLTELYLQQPRPGYALRRLVLHFRKHGGIRAIRKQLYRLNQRHPHPRKYRLALALLDLYTGRYASAIKMLKALYPGAKGAAATQLQWYLAHAYFRAQRWREARTLFAQLQKGAKRSRKKRILQALIQLDTQRGAWSAAIKWYRQLLTLRPRDLSLHLGLARTLARFHRYPDAIQQLRHALQIAPHHRRPMLWTQLVRYHLALKQYSQALRALHHARRQLIRGHWLHGTLTELEITTHRRQHTLPTLLRQYQRASKRSPKRYLPLLARLYTELQRPHDALAAYQTLLKRFPKHPAFLSGVSLLLQQGQHTKAIAWLERRLKIVPDDENTALQLLTLLHQRDPNGRFQRFFLRLLKRHPKDQLLLRKIAHQLRTWPDSIKQRLQLYPILCELKPHDARCFERWGELFWHQRKHKLAWKTWERLQTLQPPQTEHLRLLAQIYQRHGRRTQAIQLLTTLLRRKPKDLQARRLLVMLFLAARKPRRALPHLKLLLQLTRSLQRKRTTRQQLFQALLQLYPLQTVGRQLQLAYLLNPLTPEPQKLLLSFYLTRGTRTISQRIPKARYRKMLYRNLYFRRHRRYRRFPSPYRTIRVKLPRPRWVDQLLAFSLRIYPDDPELHRLAWKHHKNQPQSWHHLRKLLFLDLAQTAQYVRALKRHAAHYHKEKALRNLLQELCTRWPYQADYWGYLGEVALSQGAVTQGCQAYARAAQLAPKRLRFRLGRARCLAAQKQWHPAYRLLLQLPHPQPGKLRTIWLQEMTQFGLRAGLSFSSMIREYQQLLSNPGISIIEVIQQLQRAPRAQQLPTLRRQIKQQIRTNWALWQQVAFHEKSPKYRHQALLYLYHAPKQVAVANMLRAIRDRTSIIRGIGAIGLALLGQKQHFYLIDQIEQHDRGYDARAAARIASALLAGQYQRAYYAQALRYFALRPWLILALQRQHKQLNKADMPLLATLYDYSKRPLRWQLMQLLERLSTNAVIWLGTSRGHDRYRCFAWDGLSHLQRKTAPPQLRQIALTYKVHTQQFARHCRFTIYGP